MKLIDSNTAPRLALALAGTAFAFGLGEIALRIAPLPPLRHPQTRHLENLEKSVGLDLYPTPPAGGFDVDLRDANARARFEAEGVALGDTWRRTPFAVVGRYNQDRCRDATRVPKPPGAMRVLVLGDSFAEGQGVRQAETFARGLETRLRAHGSNVDVVNCGRRGRDFPALYTAFETLVPAYQPDIVVYAMVLNDAAQSAAFHARQQFLDDWIVDRRRMLADGDDGSLPWWRSRVFTLVSDRMEARRIGAATTAWYRDMYAEPNAAGWRDTQGYLARMRDAMAATHGRFVVELLPLLVDWRSGYPFDSTAREIERATRSLGIEFHDALPALRDRPASDWTVHAVDHHPNAAAHARIAEHLAAALR
jgi:lysophospholipase L1-like esterase